MFENNIIVRAISESDNVDNCGSKSSQFVKRVNSVKLKLVLFFIFYILHNHQHNQSRQKKKEFKLNLVSSTLPLFIFFFWGCYSSALLLVQTCKESAIIEQAIKVYGRPSFVCVSLYAVCVRMLNCTILSVFGYLR